MYLSKKLPACLLVVSMVLAPHQLSGALAQTTAPFEPGSLRQVRSLEIDEPGIAGPEGLAYIPHANAFLVLQTAGHEPGATPTLLTVSPFGRLLARSGLDVPVSSPVSMGFDAEKGLLLLLSPTTGELVQIGISDSGSVDRSSITHTDMRAQGPRDPQGMAVDPATGRLLILDAGVGQILTVDRNRAAAQEGADGVQEDQIGRIALPLPDVSGLRALAVNPANGHLILLDSAAQAIHELSPAGEIVASYPFSDVGLLSPQAMVFAPTADLTDDPARMHLYVADAGQDSYDAGIREFSFEPMALPAMALVTLSTLIQIIDTSSYPAPDPAGITFLPESNHLLISDSEVDEMPIFTGQNLYQTTLIGSLVIGSSSSTTAYSFEPTGLALNPANRHLFVSDDNQGRVFEIDPGGDGQYNTSDDSVTSFSTFAFSSLDPEGVAYDPIRGDLLITDGVNSEVYRVDPGPNDLFDGTDDVVTHFDTEVLGITDAEGIEVDPATGNVYLIGDPRTRLAQVSWDGLTLRLFDISAAGPRGPAGLAYGVSSVDPTAMSMYIADRGVDNDQDPNENDGRVYEVTLPPSTPGNQAPVVDAGPDQTIALPSAALLSGSASDDGSPAGVLTIGWSNASGPGSVSFDNPNAAVTTATFSTLGTYVLRLTADDGELTSMDNVTVTVTGPDGEIAVDASIRFPNDDAEERANGTTNLTGPELELVRYYGLQPELQGDQTIGLRFRNLAIPRGAAIHRAHIQFAVAMPTSEDTSLTIRGQDVDNAPVFTATANNISQRPPTAASAAWSPVPWTTVDAAGADQQTPDLKAIVQSIVNRPGWASGNAMAFIITGTGQRVARATAGELGGAPRLHIEYLLVEHQAPVVSAGLDQVITLPAGASLDGTVTDDGLPNPPGVVTTSWSVVSGPGTVTFGDAHAVDTTIAFSVIGDYVLQLEADDGALTANDAVTVHVTPWRIYLPAIQEQRPGGQPPASTGRLSQRL